MKKNNIQKMSKLLSQIKENIAQQQEMFAEIESELKTITSYDNYHWSMSDTRTVITGVRQFADYIHKSPATAQKILNSNVLQDYNIAYRVGNVWNFNIGSLAQLIAENPQALRC